LGIFFLRDVFSKIPAYTGIPAMSSYSVYTFLAFLFITLFYNMDMLLVKRFFESTPAGYYGAASMLAKAIFFGSIPIAGAMFPKISTWNDRGDEVVTTRLLKDTLLYTGLLAGLGTLLLNLFPGFAVSLLYGSAYGESIKLVGLFSIGMFFLSLSYVMILYQLALARENFLTFLILGGIAEVAGISLFHASLGNVVTVFTVVMALIFFSMLILVAKRKTDANAL
jgi:O-antigen/teichoic acid export membrane protein